MLATTGLFGIKTSFNTVFLICAIFLFIDAIWFIANGRALGDAGKKPFKADQREFETAGTAAKEKGESAPLTSGDWKRIIAIILVTLFSALFWMLWYMAYMPAYFRFGWGDGADYMNLANWQIGSFTIPTSWFDSVNALVCIILGPTLAVLWDKLAKRPQGDLSMFKKTALGIILVGISYIVMVVADMIASANGQCSVFWLALVCLLMSVGEMVFSPLGNSFVSKLAPAKVLGLLLGFWPIAVFIAQQIYPALYDWVKDHQLHCWLRRTCCYHDRPGYHPVGMQRQTWMKWKKQNNFIHSLRKKRLQQCSRLFTHKLYLHKEVFLYEYSKKSREAPCSHG